MLPALSVSAYELVIGSGPEGTFSYYTAKTLCRIFESQDSELDCTLNASTDEVDALTNIQGGSLDLALIDSHLLLEALTGSGPFTYLDISYDRVRAITPLYDIAVSLVVRKGAEVASSEQLPGKRVNTGPAGSPEKRIFELIMQANNWSEADFSVLSELSSSLSQDKISFRQGAVQVLVHRGVHPDPDITQLMNDSGAQLIGITGEKISAKVRQTPSLSSQKISKNYYSGVTGDIVTFGTTMTLVTSEDLDTETAQVISTALIEKEKRIQALHPSLASFRLSDQKIWFGGLKVHATVLDQAKKR